jgi:hypothetical protein
MLSVVAIQRSSVAAFMGPLFQAPRCDGRMRNYHGRLLPAAVFLLQLFTSRRVAFRSPFTLRLV